MRESIKIKTDDYNFKFRVSGLIIRNNKLLLVDMDDSGFLCLPGGYVELGETTEEAVKRELIEEIGKDVIVKKYLGVVENYFINKFGRKMHEISFYYLMDFTHLNIEESNFTLIENDKGHNIKLDFKWINLDELDKFDITIRMSPNIAYYAYIPRGNGIIGGWVRPEDTEVYEEYIDVFEFEDCDKKKEEALYRIYAEQKSWPSDLNGLISNLNYHASGKLILPDFAKVRIFCG